MHLTTLKEICVDPKGCPKSFPDPADN